MEKNYQGEYVIFRAAEEEVANLPFTNQDRLSELKGPMEGKHYK